MVVVGGAALQHLGIVERTTADVDVIALGVGTGGNIRLAQPEPIPPALERAIATVARDLGLPRNWMNTMVASQWKTGLPPHSPARPHGSEPRIPPLGDVVAKVIEHVGARLH